MPAFLGDIVNYTTATGNVVTAQVVCTETSYSPGRWENRVSPEERQRFLAEHDPSRGYEPTMRGIDVDGDAWVASPVPPVKVDRAHLKITAPNGNTYVEFNVPEDEDSPESPDEPGTPGTYYSV